MEFFGAMFGVSMGMVALMAAIVSLLFPVFWVWMLVEALLRDEREYPRATSNEKLVWVLILVLVQFSAIFYWFMVHTTIRRGSVVGLQQPVASQPSVGV